jgi:hypothetical protein
MAFITNKKVKIFVGEVLEGMNYLKASKSHFADQFSGKKNGESYYFVLRDAGNPTSGIAITDSDDASVVEKEVKLTIAHKKSVVDLTVVQSCVEVEDFKTEIGDTFALRLGAEIQKDVIAANFFKSMVATFPATGSESGWPALSKASAFLRSTRNGAKVSGYLSPEAEANLSVNALNNFKFTPSSVAEKLYGENAVGNFGGATYVATMDTPMVTCPAASAISGISAISATTAVGVGTLYLTAPTGNTAILPAGLPLQLSNAYACNSVGMRTATKMSFILQSPVTLAGATPVAATVQSIIPEDIGARNIYIEGVGSASAVSGALTCPLSAGVVYDVAQIRTNDVMNWDNVPLDDLTIGETVNGELGGIKIKATKYSDGDLLKNRTRWDVSYLAGIVDERFCANAYLPRT